MLAHLLKIHMQHACCKSKCMKGSKQPKRRSRFLQLTLRTELVSTSLSCANRVWGGRLENTYFDARMFNPNAPSKQRQLAITSTKVHEMFNTNTERIREKDFASLHALLQMGPDTPYSNMRTLNWLRFCLSFVSLYSNP